MTENIDTVDEAVEDVDEVVDDSSTEEADTEQDNSQESDGSEEGATDDVEEPEDVDEEPPTRKPRTNADWVALRRKQKLEKATKGQGETNYEDDDLEDEDDDLGVSEEDAKIIDRVVSKRLAPYEQQQQQAELQGEINEFVSANPDFKPYAARALKWAQHPSWKDVPTKQLMFAAAGDNLLKMGAKRSKQAAEKARKTKTGTGQAGNSTKGKAVADMTDEEFQNEILRVKTGG